MTEFNQEDLNHLMKLCRIKIDTEEKASLCKNLSKILNYIDKLQEINTDGVEPLSHPIELMSAPLRADNLGFMIETKEFLNNSPSHLGSMIKVPNVITKEAQDA